VRYIVVELPKGGKEIRMASPDVLHAHLFIEGEKLVGAGMMVYRPNGSAPDIRFDGVSDTYPTRESSVMSTIPSMLAVKRGTNAVAHAFRELFGEAAVITRVDNVSNA